MNIKKADLKTNARKDGEATKALIIDCAGRLIAEYGYAATTSKMICEKAQTNLAAVNYHFGSRDGLYLAVLEEVHQNLLSLDYLKKLQASPLSPHEKLEQFIDALVADIFDDGKWYVRVWAREISNPSPFMQQILTNEAMPKFAILSRIFSDITGITVGDPKLYTCMLGTMSPFVITFLANRRIVANVVPKTDLAPQEMINQLKKFVFAGLATYRQNQE